MWHVARLGDTGDAGRHADDFACVADLGHAIVTVLADAGTRQRARRFNPALLRGKGTPMPGWLAQAFPGRPRPALQPSPLRARPANVNG